MFEFLMAEHGFDTAVTDAQQIVLRQANTVDPLRSWYDWDTG